MKSEVDRRTALQLAALGVLGSQLEAAQHAMHTARTSSRAPYRPQFFATADHAELEALCEAILPGAREVKAADYIDLIAFHSSKDVQERWRAGMQAFKKVKGPDLPALLKRLENAGDTLPSEAVRLFRDTRQATVFAYYTSKPGLIDDLGYQGNVALSAFPGCEALAGQWETARMSRVWWASSEAMASVREAVSSLVPRLSGSRVVRLRLFGPKGIRRIDVEAEAVRLRMGTPAITVVPVVGSKVVVEATLEAGKDLHANGVALISGQPVQVSGEGLAVAELVKASLDKLDVAHRAVGADARDVLRVTCFCSSGQGLDAARTTIQRRYPGADIAVLQIAAVPGRTMVEAESAVKSRRESVGRLQLLNPDGLDKSPNYSQIALFDGGRAVWTGAVEGSVADPRFAFDTLRRRLLDPGASIRDVGMSCLYPSAPEGSEAIRNTRFGYYDRSRPPASTLLHFAGAPDEFTVDVIAPTA
jgi:enamine deaminase RidA (YjgF/YER057c/UK114 family)